MNEQLYQRSEAEEAIVTSSPIASRMLSDCHHEGYHSPSAHYDSVAGVLTFVLLCDCCGAVTRRIASQFYRPRFDAQGTDACWRAA